MNLIPNFSPTITTSPLAIFVPFARISNGSPASLSNSTTEPSLSLNKSLILISVLPTSTVSLTSMFSKTLKLFTAADPCFATFSFDSLSALASFSFFTSGEVLSLASSVGVSFFLLEQFQHSFFSP